jgi:integrase/recombinase XerD
MKKLRKAADIFLETNRALGYKMERHTLYLGDFVSFMERKRARFITNELAIQWAMLPKQVTPHTWAFRLRTIRRFAKYQSCADKRTEIPSTKLLASRYLRCHPYIYSRSEINKLLAAAKSPNRPFWSIESHTLYTALGLIASTGLRRSEILKLNDVDVDLQSGIIKVISTKFQKSRLVPIHPTVVKRLCEYRRHRNTQLNLKSNAFFVTKQGLRLSRSTINFAFIFASRQAGLRDVTDSFGPRLHDLRHTFAVYTLIQWLRRGVDVDNRLPALSAYLGHTDPKSTYWYFSCVPELMRLTRKKMEQAVETHL